MRERERERERDDSESITGDKLKSRSKVRGYLKQMSTTDQYVKGGGGWVVHMRLGACQKNLKKKKKRRKKKIKTCNCTWFWKAKPLLPAVLPERIKTWTDCIIFRNGIPQDNGQGKKGIFV